jgi:hypothetical protein
MFHELQPIKKFKCPKKTDEEKSGFWDEKFQKKLLKAIMVSLGFVEPTKADLKSVSIEADENTVKKAEELLAKQKGGS